MASPNYSIPPWISQPANPAAHYVTGLQIGVRIGAEQASQQFAQQQMLREQQKDEFQRQYQSQAMQMKIDEMTRKQKAITDYQNMIGQGVDPMQALMQIGPELGEDPSAIIRAKAAQDQQKGLEEYHKGLLNIQAAKAANPPMGEAERQIAAQVADEEAASVGAGGPAWSDQKRLQRRVELRSLKSFKPGLQGRLEMNPDGTMSMSFGEGATAGTQTAIQGELASLKNAVVQIGQAKNVLTEKDLGIAGGLWDKVANRWITQLLPDVGDPSVSANRAQVQKAVDSYLQNQQSRGRLSAAERAEVRESLVNPQKWGESLPRAQKVLDTMERMSKFEAVSRAKTGQQPLQDWMFNGLSQTDIKQLVQDGIITLDEGMKWASKATRR